MFVARLREEWGWNVCSASCTAGMGYRVAALAGRGGRRGCADEDMAGGVQGAGVSLLNRPCCIGWSIGGRNEGVEAEDAAAPRGYRRNIQCGAAEWCRVSAVASAASTRATRRPINKARSAGSHYQHEYCQVKLLDKPLLHLEHLYSAYSCPHPVFFRPRAAPPQHTCTMISIPVSASTAPRLTPLIQLPKAQSRHRRHETVSTPPPASCRPSRQLARR